VTPQAKAKLFSPIAQPKRGGRDIPLDVATGVPQYYSGCGDGKIC
jgi:hypothetical protein